MTSADRDMIIKRLRDFHDHLWSYTEKCRSLLRVPPPPTSELRNAVTALVIEAASVKPIVTATFGREWLNEPGARWDPWLMAFGRSYQDNLPRILASLDSVLQSVEETIGYFESKDFIDSIFRPVEPKSIHRPKVFIAHDGASDLRNRLQLECVGMMLEPIVAEEQPSLDESVDSKVDRLLEGCEFAIVLARSEAGISQDSQKIPRANIIDEIPRIRAKLGDNYIILLEVGLSLPSNQQTGVIYEHFEEEHFAEALLKVWKSLRDKSLL